MYDDCHDARRYGAMRYDTARHAAVGRVMLRSVLLCMGAI